MSTNPTDPKLILRTQPLAHELLSMVGPIRAPIVPRVEMALVLLSDLLQRAGQDLDASLPLDAVTGLDAAFGYVLMLVPHETTEMVRHLGIAFPGDSSARQVMESMLPTIRAEVIGKHVAGLQGSTRAAFVIAAASIVLAAIGQGLEETERLSPEDGQALAVFLLHRRLFPT